MGLGYGYQNSMVLIGTSSAVGATLTAAYTGNSKMIPTRGMSKINLNILYKTGTAETSNVLAIKVESSPDGIEVYQIPNESVSGATSTLTQREFQFTGADSATAYRFSLPLDINDNYYKFSFKETGVGSVFGTAFVEATLLGDR